MSEKNRADRKTYLSALCRSIPYHVVKAVLANPSEAALEQEVIDGSVMVLDLVGFTPMCERLAAAGPQSLSRLSRFLDRLFEWIELKAIFPYRGYVAQFAGDAMTCFFRDEQHEARCVAAALSVKGAMADLRGTEVAREMPDLLLRIGISTGEVILHVLGDISQKAAICAGPTPHQAVRNQMRAEPDQIVINERLRDRLGDRLDLSVDGDGRISVTGLRDWPEAGAIETLEGRLDDRQEEKIALLEPFVPPPLVKRLRGAPEGWRLQGEIRRAVIQFIDVEGFDERPEHLQHAVNIARSQLNAIRKHDGVVLNMVCTDVGHRLLVVYGLHRPAENDAEHALLAALEGVARFRGFAAELGMRMTMRVGVHQGEMFLGAIGSWYKHDLTAVGDAVNIAARVAQLASPFEVLITDEVFKSVHDEFALSAGSAIRVKGKSLPISTYQVHGAAEGRSHYIQRRRSARFVAGRAEERQRLGEIVQEAMEGRGKVVGIIGEPGTGKSYMLSGVFDRWLDGGGIGVLGRCRHAQRSVPLAPVVDMFSAYFGITPGDTDAVRADRIRAGLKHLGWIEGVEEFVSLFQPVRRPDGLPEILMDLADPHARERVLDVIQHFVEQRLTQVKPLYVLEDLHLADTLTLELIARVGLLSRESPFLLLVTYRPDAGLRNIREIVDEEVLLENLDEADSRALVSNEMRAMSVDPQLEEFLFHRTHGNPNHLMELIRFLSDRLLVNVRGGILVPAEPGLPLLEDVVPHGWHHVALARFDGLGEFERRVLRAASAIGSQFERTLIRDVAELRRAEAELEETLSILQSYRIVEAETGDGSRYKFRDDNIRAIIYSLIPEDERKEVHRRIADALERSVETLHPAAVATLAHHRDRAGQWQEAARFYKLGIEFSVRSGLDREALYMAERWETIAQKLPEEPAVDAAAKAEVAVLALLATVRQGRVVQTLDRAEEVDREHRAELSPSKRLLVDLVWGTAEAGRGELPAAIGRLSRVAVSDQAHAGIRGDAAYLIAQVHLQAGDHQAAQSWWERSRELVQEDPYRRAFFTLLEGDLQLHGGRMEEARRLYNGIREQAQTGGRLQLLSLSLRGLGTHGLLAEDFKAARLHLHHALALDRRCSVWAFEVLDLLLLGQVHLWSESLESARMHLERALVLAQDLGHEVARATALVDLGAVIGLSEDPDEGQRVCEEGLGLARRFGLKPVQLVAGLNLLRLAHARGDAEAAARAAALCAEHEALATSPLLRGALVRMAGRR